jgi:uncharacterized protein (TIGR03437 family)
MLACNGASTTLTSTFISATQLTAVIPASLITSNGEDRELRCRIGGFVRHNRANLTGQRVNQRCGRATQVQVVFQGLSSSMVSVPVVTAQPGVFSLDGSGRGPGAIVNQNGAVNSATNPASPGSIVTIFATGEGQTSPVGIDGKPDGFPAPTPIAQPVTATIGGLSADVQYAGGVPGLVAGFLQVNVRVPAAVPTGSTVPVILSIEGASSQASVTMVVGPPSP